MSASRAVAGVVTALYLAALGWSALRIGTVFLTVALTSAVLSSGIGLAADRVGRRPFLVAAPLLAAGAGVAFATSHAAVVLYAFAALGSFGRGAGAGAGQVGPYQPAESALLTESAPPAERTAAFGRIAFFASLGALGGGLLAGLVRPGRAGAAAAEAAYRPAFLAAAVLAAAAGLGALLLREPPRAPSRRHRLVLPRRSWPVLWRFWVTNSVNGLAVGVFGPFISYWLYRRYGASPSRIGVLFAVVNAATLVSSLSAARIGRALGTVRAIVVVRVVQAVLLLPMALAPDFTAAGAWYLVRMLAQRVGLPLRQSYVQQVADPAERASVAALAALPAQGTQAGGQLLAGYLFDEVSLAAPFELAALLQLVNAGLYAALFGRRSAGGSVAATEGGGGPP